MYSFELLIELIQASGMPKKQKDSVIEKVSDLPEAKKILLYKVLVKEQQEKNKILKEWAAKKKAYEQKRAQIIYSYIERRVAEEEAETMADIDSFLADKK